MKQYSNDMNKNNVVNISDDAKKLRKEQKLKFQIRNLEIYSTINKIVLPFAIIGSMVFGFCNIHHGTLIPNLTLDSNPLNEGFAVAVAVDSFCLYSSTLLSKLNNTGKWNVDLAREYDLGDYCKEISDQVHCFDEPKHGKIKKKKHLKGVYANEKRRK